MKTKQNEVNYEITREKVERKIRQCTKRNGKVNVNGKIEQEVLKNERRALNLTGNYNI